MRGVKFNAETSVAMEGGLNPIVTIEIREGKSSSGLNGSRHASTAASAPKAETNAETEGVSASDVSIITQKAEQAIAAAKAATAALANLE
ncbi:MAG: hypothetical protein IKS92_09985, partial [Victivallales bacterium]|nr:hypothetical protein [Victivallales bacterium]